MESSSTLLEISQSSANEFIQSDWVDLIHNKTNEICIEFKECVGIFAKALKETIKTKILVTNDQVSILGFISQLQSATIQLSTQLSEIDNQPNNQLSERTFIEEDKVEEIIVNENICDQDFKTHEKDYENVSNFEDSEFSFFVRVLEIFEKKYRSIPELFSAIDKNRDGKIIPVELRAELVRHDPSITFEESSELFNVLDGNKDGLVTLDELTKRWKFLKQKAEIEKQDPLSCLIVSKPLDPNLISGTISVTLLNVNIFKSGTHSIKLKIRNSLEYMSEDFTGCNKSLNFKCDFLIENKSPQTMPKYFEVELINKNKIEGTARFCWCKELDVPCEYSNKVTVDLKTSSKQSRGLANFQISWSQKIPKILSETEVQRLEILKHLALEKQKLIKTEGLNTINERPRSNTKPCNPTFSRKMWISPNESRCDFDDLKLEFDDSPILLNLTKIENKISKNLSKPRLVKNHSSTKSLDSTNLISRTQYNTPKNLSKRTTPFFKN